MNDPGMHAPVARSVSDAKDFPPRLSPALAERFTGLTSRQLKGLRERRAVRFYRLGRRTLVYDRDSLAALLAARMVEALPLQ